MKIFDPSSTVRVGDAIRLPLYCSEPGSVVITSSDEGVASVASPVTVGGSRTWRNGLKHGQYLARQTSDANGRIDVSFCIEIDWDDIAYCSSSVYFERQILAGSENYAAVNRTNWSFSGEVSKLSGSSVRCRLIYLQSATPAGNTVSHTGSAVDSSSAIGVRRYVVTLPNVATDNNVYFYHVNGTAPDVTIARSNTTSGTMGGTEYLTVQAPIKIAKFARLLDQSEREGYVQSGTIPATPELSYQGGHEIVETAPVFWDTSGADLDLRKVDVLYWPPAAASGDYTDDPLNPVQPYQYIDVLAQGVGSATITARRRRNGVPYRTPALPDAEVYEETTYVLTVAAATALEQSTVQLMIYADRDGTATIAMDNPIIAFPASVPVVEGKNQVSGLVTGSGTCNVTVTLDGVSDVTTFNVEEMDVNVGVGPDQSLSWPGEDITFDLTVSCDRPETTVALTYSDPSITGPASVYIDGPPVVITVTASNYGNFTVTGESGSHSGAAAVTIADGRFVSISPDTIINELDPDVYLTVEGSCAGTVALSVSPATGLTIPATVTLTAGALRQEIVCTAELLGDYTVTASFLTKSDTATVGITEVPVLVKIGPDDDDITMLHIVTNRPGTVYLTSDDPEHVTVPLSVDVPVSLETQVRAIFTQSGIYTITATFRGAQDHCVINYDASYCILTGTITDVGGRPKRLVSIVSMPTAEQQVINGNLLRVEPVTARTNHDGTFELRLLRGADLILIIDQISMRMEFTVPDQATVDISEL